jgi:hypothetical protein
MLHLIQLLKYLHTEQGYSYRELTDLFENYFVEEGHSIEDILDFFCIEINNTQYIEKALPKVSSALNILKMGA